MGYDAVSEKALKVFGRDKVIEKALVREYKHFTGRVPAFISEFIVGKCAGLPPHRMSECFSKYKALLPDPDEKDKILYEISRNGSYTIIDEFRVTVKFSKGNPTYNLHVPSLGIENARVSESVLDEYRELLGAGVWGLGKLAYKPQAGGGGMPIELVEFVPFQVTGVRLKEFKEARRRFTLEEWVDLLIASLGLKPAFLGDIKRKLLYLSRLLPMVEDNLHMLELGPRGTGKSFVYKNMSHYAWLISGGTVSAAVLFYDLRLKTAGQVALRDVLVFDEVAKIKFSSPEVVSKLKDFMESGSFDRGLWRGQSGCSLVFIGNTDVTELTPSIIRDLPGFMDSALLDRVCGFIEGWRMPKLASSDVSLAEGYGLYVFYLAEVLHLLRKESFADIAGSVEVEGATIRDERSIRRMVSAFAKVLVPHGEYDRKELALMVEAANSLRQGVRRMLHYALPHEYSETPVQVKIS